MAIHRAPLLGIVRALGLMSIACATKRTSTSPSSHLTSNRVVRSVMRAGLPGVVLALVVTLLRELLWIRSGSCAGACLELVG